MFQYKKHSDYLRLNICFVNGPSKKVTGLNVLMSA